jgi:hypothetical protein
MTRKLILEGWNSYRREVLPAGAPEIQIEECRRAYYSGAMILFTSIMGILDPGTEEATEKDMAQMAAIDDEIKAYGAEMKAKAGRGR